MMKIIFLLIVLLSFQIGKGQVIEQSNNKSAQELFDYHTLKQKKNKTVAWVVLGGGISMTTLGILIDTFGTTIECVPDFWECAVIEGSHKGNWLIYLGSASTIASIPFFISAGKNKRKATLSLKGEQNIVRNIKIDNSNYLALNITFIF